MRPLLHKTDKLENSLLSIGYKKIGGHICHKEAYLIVPIRLACLSAPVLFLRYMYMYHT